MVGSGGRALLRMTRDGAASGHCLWKAVRPHPSQSLVICETALVICETANPKLPHFAAKQRRRRELCPGRASSANMARLRKNRRSPGGRGKNKLDSDSTIDGDFSFRILNVWLHRNFGSEYIYNLFCPTRYQSHTGLSI